MSRQKLHLKHELFMEVVCLLQLYLHHGDHVVKSWISNFIVTCYCIWNFRSSTRPGVHLYDVAYFWAVKAQSFSCISLHCSMRCCKNNRKHVKTRPLTLQTDWTSPWCVIISDIVYGHILCLYNCKIRCTHAQYWQMFHMTLLLIPKLVWANYFWPLLSSFFCLQLIRFSQRIGMF